MISRASTSRALLLCTLTAACAELPDLAPGICGNGVLEAGEQCDLREELPGTQCADPGDVLRQCRYVCSREVTGPRCPAGWGCGADGVCRRAGRLYEEGVDSPIEIDSVGFARVTDFDANGRQDLVVGGLGTGLSVLLQGRGGGYGAPIELALGGTLHALGDVDGDERPDAMSISSRGLLASFGTSQRTLEQAVFPDAAFGDSVVTGGEARYLPCEIGAGIPAVLSPEVGGIRLTVPGGGASLLIEGPASGWASRSLPLQPEDGFARLVVAPPGVDRVTLLEIECADWSRVVRTEILLPAGITVGQPGFLGPWLFAADLGADGDEDLYVLAEERGQNLLVVAERTAPRSYQVGRIPAPVDGGEVVCPFEMARPSPGPWHPLTVGDLTGDSELEFVDDCAVRTWSNGQWIPLGGVPEAAELALIIRDRSGLPLLVTSHADVGTSRLRFTSVALGTNQEVTLPSYVADLSVSRQGRLSALLWPAPRSLLVGVEPPLFGGAGPEAVVLAALPGTPERLTYADADGDAIDDLLLTMRGDQGIGAAYLFMDSDSGLQRPLPLGVAGEDPTARAAALGSFLAGGPGNDVAALTGDALVLLQGARALERSARVREPLGGRVPNDASLECARLQAHELDGAPETTELLLVLPACGGALAAHLLVASITRGATPAIAWAEVALPETIGGLQQVVVGAGTGGVVELAVLSQDDRSPSGFGAVLSLAELSVTRGGSGLSAQLAAVRAVTLPRGYAPISAVLQNADADPEDELVLMAVGEESGLFVLDTSAPQSTEGPVVALPADMAASLLSSGDLDGDGLTDLIASAPFPRARVHLFYAVAEGSAP